MKRKAIVSIMDSSFTGTFTYCSGLSKNVNPSGEIDRPRR